MMPLTMQPPGPWIERVVIRTAREILSGLPRLREDLRSRCRTVQDLEAAQSVCTEIADWLAPDLQLRILYPAALAARDLGAAAASAADPWRGSWRESAALAASAAERAAFCAQAAGSADRVLTAACRIWADEQRGCPICAKAREARTPKLT
jgi:hypothetical protein